MSNLESIKKRIQSIEVTAKITFAMKMVTTVKLQKYKKKYQIYQNYFAGIMNVFRETINNPDLDLKTVNRLFYEYNKCNQTSEKKLYVAFGSDLGMCGRYNSEIVKKLRKLIKDPEKDQLIVYGTRLHSIINSQHPEWKILDTVSQIDRNLDTDAMFIEALDLFDHFLKNDFSSIIFVYTKFINSLTFEPETFQVLPIKLESYNDKSALMSYAFEENLSHYELGFHVEPVVISLIPQLFTHLFYAVLLEAKISESSSRFNAMNAATDNANALLDEYKLEYNRTRQASITQEIIEIISGSSQKQRK
ncbi:F-type H+-transporting ATPase subunit gamma [Mycoplasmoides fastidiosum]|uniref:F-type H+-transporting ATPase subunit gamma n=1 Tax=Mycoplasmoides fastidiosum TaxID=92758 RepID=A0ABU0LYJ1_9BACT|nr:ATP synthase F1 subunit gamma [Mycoplasmoides fastidiosum]MDQ0513764.1 F-type H+-transporting ATPase subunit gamma [Mycoplasmoides fastidiosum]UUD37816.1 ATP synthase F1 subunit gamma [Mycoplasmoides fastidiosum]